MIFRIDAKAKRKGSQGNFTTQRFLVTHSSQLVQSEDAALIKRLVQDQWDFEVEMLIAGSLKDVT